MTQQALKGQGGTLASSVGKIQIGNSPSDVTTFIGSVNVPDPVTPDNAANKRYVDRIATSSAAMAAVLDTKRPAEGTNSNVSISTAGSDVSSAIGLNYSGALFANSQAMDKSFLLIFHGHSIFEFTYYGKSIFWHILVKII